MRFHIPLRLPSLANERYAWWELARVKKQQKLTTKLCMRGREVPPPPLLVTITRVGPQRLDDDNLSSACKYVRDQIAAIVGIDDGSDQYTWRYEQRIGEFNVEVEVTSR